MRMLIRDDGCWAKRLYIRKGVFDVFDRDITKTQMTRALLHKPKLIMTYCYTGGACRKMSSRYGDLMLSTVGRLGGMR